MQGYSGRRFLDQIDAEQTREKWFEAIIDLHGFLENPTAHITHALHENDGCTSTMWLGGQPAAQAIIVRDDANYSVLTLVDLLS